MQFHVTVSVALSSDKVKYILMLRLVVILPALVFYCITAYSLVLSFSIILFVSIVELHPLSHNILNLLNIDLLSYSTWMYEYTKG